MRNFPCVILPGVAGQAVEYYAKIFNAKASVVKYGEMPNYPAGGADKDRVARAQLNKDKFVLALRDAPKFMDEKMLNGSDIMITVMFDTVEKAKKIFDALSVDCKMIAMPFDKQIFAKGFGILKDKYNVGWEIMGDMHDDQVIPKNF
ncbi:MAG: VOC family protein [Clostridiales bacterium]|jgi:PhnB protein|nr:VOC family protein [Clostridiales bacterium]